VNDDLYNGFRLGAFDVMPSQNTVSGPGGTVRVEPKSMAVLACLVRSAGDTVSRNDLIEAGWPGLVVTDDVLSRCIAQLRRAFGDNARSPRYLETIPKRGYRLMKPVEATGTVAEQASVSSQRQGIVVLPFQNNSPGRTDDYVADGLTELLSARLATLKEMRVISRTTAMSFAGTGDSVPDIAARLGVEWVVEGSVMVSKDNVQVVAQLIDARRDEHVWADTYFRAVTDLLILQNEITDKIAAQVGRELGMAAHGIAANGRSIAPRALRLYLQGRQQVARRTIDSLRKAARCFEEVSAIEPQFSEGWACQAEVLKLLMHYGAEPPDEKLQLAQGLAEKALAIDPESAIALTTRGSLRMFFYRDIDGATSDLRRALHSQPDYLFALLSLANAATINGDFRQSRAWLRRAVDVDPLDVGVNMNLGDHLILHRRYSDAGEQLRATLDLDGEHWPSRLRLAWALSLAGDCATAADELGGVCEQVGETAAYLEYGALVAGSCKEPARAGEFSRRLETLVRSGTFVSPWALARSAAAAGDERRALEHLRHAQQKGSSSLAFFGVTPAFDGLRQRPAGQDLLRSLKLPNRSQAKAPAATKP